MKRISVIVPVYNVAPYLARALDSLVSQTIGNLEIICVDDGSTDESGKILDAYAASHKNIIVIRFPENCGVSVARNAGIGAATGEYLGFVDPDDYVDYDFYEKLYNAAGRTDADMALGNIHYNFKDQVGVRDDLMARVEKNKHEFMYCWWAAIYRRRMIMDNDIRFPPGIICGQDFVFLNRAVIMANKVKVVPNTFYHYEYRENSSFSDVLSAPKIESQLRARKMLLEFMNSRQDMRAEDYMIIWAAMLRNFFDNLFTRNTNHDTRLSVTHGAIDFYRESKFKTLAGMKIREMDDSLYRFFESNDANGLCEFLTSAEKQRMGQQTTDVQWFRLFGLFKIIKIETFQNKDRRARLFGFLTIYSNR